MSKLLGMPSPAEETGPETRPVAGLLDRLDRQAAQLDRQAAQLEEQARLMARMARQLDHLDELLHGLNQFIDANKDLLGKARALTDNPIARVLGSRKPRA
jgi:ABC-type transporter Mla subunit MlaD